eukprot:COSAG02_NODE_41751_length_391_cov_1.006849_1_plen_71_part_01
MSAAEGEGTYNDEDLGEDLDDLELLLDAENDSDDAAEVAPAAEQSDSKAGGKDRIESRATGADGAQRAALV